MNNESFENKITFGYCFLIKDNVQYYLKQVKGCLAVYCVG